MYLPFGGTLLLHTANITRPQKGPVVSFFVYIHSRPFDETVRTMLLQNDSAEDEKGQKDVFVILLICSSSGTCIGQRNFVSRLLI